MKLAELEKKGEKKSWNERNYININK